MNNSSASKLSNLDPIPKNLISTDISKNPVPDQLNDTDPKLHMSKIVSNKIVKK